MKHVTRILLPAALCLCLAVLLCSCSTNNPRKLVGTWMGDGTLSAPNFGADSVAPFDRARALTLREDGTGAVEAFSGTVSLTWNASDSTLTLSFGQLGSWGMRYECKGNTLTLPARDGNAVFIRVS